MTDWGTEFMGEFVAYCKDKQISMHKSCPYSAWQNGLVERANRTLSNLARAMLIDSQLGPQFWGLALSHAAFISNRVCHSGMNKTPFELVFLKRPNLSKLRVWGCPGVVHLEDRYVPKDLSHPHAEPGIFVGYCDQSPSFLFFLPRSNRIVSRRDAVMFEDRPGVLVGKTTVVAPAVSHAPDVQGFAWLKAPDGETELDETLRSAGVSPGHRAAESLLPAEPLPPVGVSLGHSAPGASPSAPIKPHVSIDRPGDFLGGAQPVPGDKLGAKRQWGRMERHRLMVRPLVN